MGGGLGFIVGGALSGLGAGMVKQGEMQAEDDKQSRAAAAKARYDTMIENLRAQREADNIKLRGTVDDAVDANRQERKAGYDAENDDRDTDNTIKVESVKHKNRLGEIGAEGSNQIGLATVRAGLDRANSDAEIRLRDQLDAGDLVKTIRGADGFVYGVTKAGRSFNSGVKYQPNAAENADDDVLGPPSTSTSTSPALKFIRDPKTNKIVRAQ